MADANELSEMERHYSEQGFKFIVIYGRRRVGKTVNLFGFAKYIDTDFNSTNLFL